jgi:hypothetical protein
MAFIESAVIHDGWTGTKTLDEKVDSFSVQYMVRVDDKQDGPRFVLEQCGLPTKGALYNAGSDNHPAAVCKSVSVSPLGENVWRATVSYGASTDKEDKAADELDEENKPTDDVTLEGIEVQISLVQMSRPAVRAIYLGQTKGGHNRVLENIKWNGGPFAEGDAGSLGTNGALFTGIPVTNSCSTAFDPPVEVDYSRIQVTLTRNEMELNANRVLQYNDTVNLHGFNLSYRGFNLDVPAYSAKMQTIGTSRRIKEGVVYWRVNYEFHIDSRFGWRAELLDRGYGMTSEFDQLAQDFRSTEDIPVGMGTMQPIVNQDTGFTLTEPVNLDGQGFPLKLNEPPIYLVYGVYKEIDWAPLKLNQIGVLI